MNKLDATCSEVHLYLYTVLSSDWGVHTMGYKHLFHASRGSMKTDTSMTEKLRYMYTRTIKDE